MLAVNAANEKMQGYHQQHQQFVALLTAAFPKGDQPKTIVAGSSPSSEEDESRRLTAITSLHRAILYPPNGIAVSHAASFLAQGFAQLVNDKLFSVRHAAARAYGALCSVACFMLIAPNGRQSHVMLGSLIDGFIGWSLPSLRNIISETSQLALESLHEFLSVGDVGATERYAFPILKACQELLEDERMPFSVMPRVLGVLTLISMKFFRFFQPHFKDIVDILLGWALIPGITESDKHVIMDSLLQFQKHWVNNLQFSLGLLSKFLDDMDSLLHDGSGGGPQQFKRLLALLSCFCTVLQSAASGFLEINSLENIREPLTQMLPVLLRCLSMIGKKFGWPEWIEQSWKCLTLLAEILSERFSGFYPAAVDILFDSLDANKISSFQVHGVLKTNLQLMSLQKLGLIPSSIPKILHFDKPISQLRLHPNHLVTGSAAVTYIFLLQHEKTDVVESTMNSLFDELQLLKTELLKNSGDEDQLKVVTTSNAYSKDELVCLISFIFKVILSCPALQGRGGAAIQVNEKAFSDTHGEKLAIFLIENFNLFEWPFKSSLELQIILLKTLESLSTVNFMRKCSFIRMNGEANSQDTLSGAYPGEDMRNQFSMIMFDHLRVYIPFLVRALDISSPFAIKMEALAWICKFCELVIDKNRSIRIPFYPCLDVAWLEITQDLLFSTLVVTSDQEPDVRARAVTVLQMLLKAKLIHPRHFPSVAQIVLEKLGDPETDIRNAYLRLFLDMWPLNMYTCIAADVAVQSSQPRLTASVTRSCFCWKQIFALKQLPQQLLSHQLFSILSYMSRRLKVSISSWIQRLVLSCHSKKRSLSIQPEETDVFDAIGLWSDIQLEEDFLERAYSVNYLAGAWWAIHEAARFCITTKLRTNLGGPTQTFAALERMLLDISQVLQLEMEQTDGTSSLMGSNAHLLPMRLLLEFVEALRKNVYNAYEGSTILPRSSRTSSLFFSANKKVCEEWFSRITEPMMEAGLVLQCNHATIHYCVRRLLDISSYVSSALLEKSRVLTHENPHKFGTRYHGDFLRIIRNMALALCKIHEPDALVGLQRWATVVFSPLNSTETQGLSDIRNLGQFSFITGLVYQARGQYEKAAAYFIHLLQSEESLSSMGATGVQFSIARIIESYSATSDWRSLESWLVELQNIRSKYAGKSFSGALTTAGNEINYIQALGRFDEQDFKAARSYLDLTPKISNEITLDPRFALQRSEQMLLQAMLLEAEGKIEKVSDVLENAKHVLEEALTILPLDGLVEAAPYANQLFCISKFEEGYRHRGSAGKGFQSILNGYIQTMQFPLLGQAHQDCGLWLKLFRIFQNVDPVSVVTLELCKNLVLLGRKQKNLMLASRLNGYLKDHASICLDESSRLYFTLCGEYEDALILHAENKIEAALMNLLSFVRPFIASCSTGTCNFHEDALKAKACLKLSHWLQEDFLGKKLGIVDLEMQELLRKVGVSSSSKEGVISTDGNQNSHSGLSGTVDELVGSFMKASTLLCPMMGKSWIMYASWCYTQATTLISPDSNRVVDSCSVSSVFVPEVHCKRFVANEGEKLRVKNLILRVITDIYDGKEILEDGEDQNISVVAGDKLKLLLPQIICAIEIAAATPGEESGGNSISDKLFSELKNYLISTDIAPSNAEVTSCVADLVDVYLSLRRRRVSLLGEAAQGFINFLSFSYSKSLNCQITGFHLDSKFKHASYTLKSTLHVLHILVNYGVELKDILNPALSKVPILPWQEITPQILARLSSHPERMVRKQLEALLINLAEFSPWSLVYPTLLDSNSPDKEPSEEIQRILACLNASHPQLVQDAQLVIVELGNVTVLWEELWLGTLHDLHADVLRRIHLLKEEAVRVGENTTLTQEEKNKINAAKYTAMMAPIIVTLERRLTSTSRKPITPHEVWFLHEYKEKIDSAIRKFKIPPVSIAALGDIWRPFELIEISLASNQRKSPVSLGEVAPRLASLLSSSAPMPGVEKQVMVSECETTFNSSNNGIVTIASFSDQLTILPTKTKPKKIAIVGSDGQKYTYLLKGREDLRLDARIMLLLQSVNSFMQSSAAMAQKKSLSIRSYSVTPISGGAGLIQWVDNSISIYSVFKSWQKRAQLQQISALGPDTNTVVPPVPRPSDMFYGKIIPALKEKGIRRVISRRDWPHDIKKNVLLDLMKETPKQLLYQELWCSSEGFKAFSSKLSRFSGSVAAMSILGHVLGLGDRHLDNILVDFLSGEIVHIDYNVCFDKGQRLKIPEIVPFRLTQTIEAVLGLTGVEGPFRLNCETVLGSLKKNKDIILMLLEVFVWDPLVEWTRANVHDDAAVVGEERKGMELAVSLSLFASRAQEIRVPLQEHHDLLLPTLFAVESALERFINTLNDYEMVSFQFNRADQERSSCIQREKSAKLVFAEAASSSEQSRVLFDMQVREFTQAKSTVRDKGQEAAAWLEKHGRIFEALRNSSIQEIKELSTTGSEEDLSLMSSVVGAGVPWTVVPEPTQIHCEDIDKEVSYSVSELARGLSSAITALQIYSFVLQKILPFNYIATSPVHGWAQIMLSLDNPSSEIISIAQRQGTELINSDRFDIHGVPNSKYNDLCFKLMQCTDDIKRMDEECLSLEISIRPEMESASKDRLVSEFINYIELVGFKRRGESSASGAKLERRIHNDVEMVNEEKKGFLLTVLDAATGNLFSDIKHTIQNSLDHFDKEKTGVSLKFAHEAFINEFEEQIERCVLVTESLAELKHYAVLDINDVNGDANILNDISQESWVSIFKSIILHLKNLVRNLADVVMPILMNSAASFNSDVMEISGTISQIRRSIEPVLDQLIQVELERDSMKELESNYYVKVGLITEKQLALEEAAVNGRDHLSWEESEELAAQEEACRVQLDNLHQTWNQKDMRASSLERKETNINNCLEDAELQLQSFIIAEHEREPHALRRKTLVASLFEPFSDLELVDQALISSLEPVSSSSSGFTQIIESLNSGASLSKHVWIFRGLKTSNAFFIWKVFLVDILLGFYARDVVLSVDQNLGREQLKDVAREELRSQFNEHICRYVKDRVAPIFLTVLDRKIEMLLKSVESVDIPKTGRIQLESGGVRRLQTMLEEYCNMHQTLRSARSAAALMRNQINELKDVSLKTSLEICRMEWIHNITSRPLEITNLFISDKYHLLPLVLNTNRVKLLESMQLSISQVAKSLERLQSCEGISAAAEKQLEGAMNWACGDSSSISGIPSQFYDHLTARRKHLQEIRQNAADVVKLCISVLEFEASRDGVISSTYGALSSKTGMENVAWQQSCLNAIAKLDLTYHSFIRSEKEWRLAQSNMEAASNSLVSAANELSLTFLNAASASGDLKSTLLAMKDSSFQASVPLSAYGSIIRGHTALTSDCGSMLEEVLAITEDFHDVHGLAKEAAILHSSLMKELSKANAVLIPLESQLSKDVSMMTDAMAQEIETKSEIDPIHGQAIFQSYYNRVNEALQVFKPLVPSLTLHIQGLFSTFTRLAKIASLHAGNLHKALEGVGENLQGSPQEINPLADGLCVSITEHEQQSEIPVNSYSENEEDTDGLNIPNSGWISPPLTFSSGSTVSDGAQSGDIGFPEDANILEEVLVTSGCLFSQSKDDSPHEVPSTICYSPRSCSHESDIEIKQEASNISSVQGGDGPLVNAEKPRETPPSTSRSNAESICPAQFRKNAYAVSLLRRVEMKIDGRDIVDNREIGIAEQVDFLLRQATDLDNLCNMYEGWTPWI